MSSFENLKDDSSRLNEHTKTVIEEFAMLTRKWEKEGIDARAIYAGFETFHQYYYWLGFNKLGSKYLSVLDTQAKKLADELLSRVKSF